MDYLVKQFFFVIFILSVLWKCAESYSLNFKSIEYVNGSLLPRFRRQFQGSKSNCCVTPEQPHYGRWVYYHNGTEGEANQEVDVNSVIKFSCLEGYKLSSTDDSNYLIFCSSDGSWNVPEMPTCQKICQPLYNTLRLTLTCNKEDGSRIPCDKATDKTILRYKCAPYYEPADGRTDSILCYHNGEWERIPECVPVCGEIGVSASDVKVNGQIVERGDYPWVVAIYSNKDTSPNFTNICSGSLLKPDVVLSAAQCVTNSETGKAYFPRYYRVAAGKYYYMYGDSRDFDTAQYVQVAEIKISNEYIGEVQNFRGDIALLRLKTAFGVSKLVQPICYLNLPESIPKTLGLVTGWGCTTSSENPSDVLKSNKVPYTENEQCKSELDEEFAQRHLTYDKFCAGFYNGNVPAENEIDDQIEPDLQDDNNSTDEKED